MHQVIIIIVVVIIIVIIVVVVVGGGGGGGASLSKSKSKSKSKRKDWSWSLVYIYIYNKAFFTSRLVFIRYWSVPTGHWLLEMAFRLHLSSPVLVILGFECIEWTMLSGNRYVPS